MQWNRLNRFSELARTNVPSRQQPPMSGLTGSEVGSEELESDNDEFVTAAFFYFHLGDSILIFNNITAIFYLLIIIKKILSIKREEIIFC